MQKDMIRREQDLKEAQDMSSEMMFLQELEKIPPLSKEEERSLIERMINNDQEAKKILWEHNLRLIKSIARRYQNRGLEFLDLFQEGSMGIKRALDKFDIEKGEGLSNYLINWIIQSIERAIHNKGNGIRIPVYLNEEIEYCKKNYAKFGVNLDDNPSKQELAKTMNISKSRSKNMLMAYSRLNIMSLDALINDENQTNEMECIDSTKETMEESVIHHILTENVETFLESGNLTPREINILKEIYGINQEEPTRYSQIAEKYHITHQRVYQIEKKAIKKLRKQEIYQD